MKTVLYKNEERGYANHGWLKSHHTFSFAGYYNPAKINFGMLRVVNDDSVLGGYGFGTHPHDNMEIVSIPLQGAIRHQDSIGTNGVIKTGDVQIMSAGYGIEHSEYNNSKTEELKFLQIWVFPKKKDIEPRYQQLSYDPAKMKNTILEVVSPEQKEDTLWINQDAYFSLSELDQNESLNYQVRKPNHGVFVFALEGALELSDLQINRRDAVGVYQTENFELKAKQNSRILFIEVPMN